MEEGVEKRNRSGTEEEKKRKVEKSSGKRGGKVEQKWNISGKRRKLMEK